MEIKGIEPLTSCMRSRRSTPELYPQLLRGSPGELISLEHASVCGGRRRVLAVHVAAAVAASRPLLAEHVTTYKAVVHIENRRVVALICAATSHRIHAPTDVVHSPQARVLTTVYTPHAAEYRGHQGREFPHAHRLPLPRMSRGTRKDSGATGP